MTLGLFESGQIVMTSGIASLVKKHLPFQVLIQNCLTRHLSGDWGNLCEDDKEMNELALHDNDRIFSAYQLDDEIKIYIITEWDRSVTTVLLPSEY